MYSGRIEPVTLRSEVERSPDYTRAHLVVAVCAQQQQVRHL